jgi:hypothetical protein
MVSEYQYIQLCQMIKALELENKSIKARIQTMQTHIVSQVLELIKENLCSCKDKASKDKDRRKKDHT